MKPMKYKHDLEMWHKFAEFAEHLKFVSESQEQTLYSKCTYYSFDNDAFEEYCKNPKIKRKKDFLAKEECWKCQLFNPKFIEEKAKNTLICRFPTCWK